MHRHSGFAAAVLLSLCAWSCGGEEPGMQVKFQSQALLEQADFVVTYIYEGTRNCADIRAEQPRGQPVLGPYRFDLDDDGRNRGVVSRITDFVPAGVFTVFVDAFGAAGLLVGTGCAPDQEVFSGEVATIKVVVSEN